MQCDSNSYRIRTSVGTTGSNVINVKLDQTYDTLEILSLKISQKNVYKRFQSDYGVVVGRVLANGGFGIPNAKVSVFIPIDDSADEKESMMYPFTLPTDTDSDRVRYNLLPEYVDEECHQDVGTFPTKRTLLDNDDIVEIFDKYYKYTTVTNNAGDYMLFGVPTGTQSIHVDIDLSDIGVLSQRPRDMIYKGYDVNQFESPNMFRKDANLNSLMQIKSQDTSVYVYPYWGDTSNESGEIAISRCDINIDYKFEPTCIFMGSIISDSGSNAFGKYCKSSDHMGEMSTLVAGMGKIEMIRKTFDGKVEEFPIKGNALINDNGVWCYQIPMNLDYVVTDEFGNIVPSDNPEKGIPTRTRVRFRISMNETPSDSTARKRCRYLVPNNPRLDEDDYPEFYKTHEVDYEFGTKTNEENYRDLLWNKVYTVKNYIPRLQKHTHNNHKTFSGIKLVNDYGDNNPMPYNSIVIKLGFMYKILCNLTKLFVDLVTILNNVLTALCLPLCVLRTVFRKMHGIKILGVRVFGFITSPMKKILTKMIPNCIHLDSDMCDGETTHSYTFYPGCGYLALNAGGLNSRNEGCIKDVTRDRHNSEQMKKKEEDRSEFTTNDEELRNCIETSLANQNDALMFNFTNDWINGTLYMPLWFRNITTSRRWFFGLFKKKAKDQWCSSDNSMKNKGLYCIPTCSISSKAKDYTNFKGERKRAYVPADDGCKECHKKIDGYFGFNNGIIVSKETILGETVYYYKSVEYDNDNESVNYTPVHETNDGSVKLMFATDIVLLGSLDKFDNQGIPQFFNKLESTTFSMPPNLLSTDNDLQVNEVIPLDEEGKEDIERDRYAQLSQNSITEKTGRDWGNNNDDICDKTSSGLFYGIGCSNTTTYSKSCVNLRRICEYGISLDESKDILNRTEANESDSVIYDTLIPDGYISKDEVYDENGRTIFATLNGNNLRTKIDETTGLIEYEFIHYIVNNFDGSLYDHMKKTQKKCDKTQRYNYFLEQFSQGYYDFRMGKNPYFYDEGHRFPRFENSFYFYFGLKSGKTAIDVFNNEFFSDCNSNKDNEDLVKIITSPDEWCTDKGGYVGFDLTDVELPCQMTFIYQNSDGIQYNVDDVKDTKIYFAKEEFNDDDLPVLLQGYKYIQIEDGYIANGYWEVVITDANGNIIRTNFNKKGEYLKSDIVVTSFELTDDNLIDIFKNRDLISNLKYKSDDADKVRTIGGYFNISFPVDSDGNDIKDFSITVKGENYSLAIKGKNGTVSDNDIQATGDAKKTHNGIYGYEFSSNSVLNDYNSAKEFKIGLPRVNSEYEITVTQLCGDFESGNQIRETIFVGVSKPLKLYINNVVDYDTIKDWGCGFSAKYDNDLVIISDIRGESGVSSKWFNMSNRNNYNWELLNTLSDPNRLIVDTLNKQKALIEGLSEGERNIYTFLLNNLKNSVNVRIYEDLKYAITSGKEYYIDNNGFVYKSKHEDGTKPFDGFIHNKLVYGKNGDGVITIFDVKNKESIENITLSNKDIDVINIDLFMAKGMEEDRYDSDYASENVIVTVENRNGGYDTDKIYIVFIKDNPYSVWVVKDGRKSDKSYDNSDGQFFNIEYVKDGEALSYEEWMTKLDNIKDDYGNVYVKTDFEFQPTSGSGFKRAYINTEKNILLYDELPYRIKDEKRIIFSSEYETLDEQFRTLFYEGYDFHIDPPSYPYNERLYTYITEEDYNALRSESKQFYDEVYLKKKHTYKFDDDGDIDTENEGYIETKNEVKVWSDENYVKVRVLKNSVNSGLDNSSYKYYVKTDTVQTGQPYQLYQFVNGWMEEVVDVTLTLSSQRDVIDIDSIVYENPEETGYAKYYMIKIDKMGTLTQIQVDGFKNLYTGRDVRNDIDEVIEEHLDDGRYNTMDCYDNYMVVKESLTKEEYNFVTDENKSYYDSYRYNIKDDYKTIPSKIYSQYEQSCQDFYDIDGYEPAYYKEEGENKIFISKTEYEALPSEEQQEYSRAFAKTVDTLISQTKYDSLENRDNCELCYVYVENHSDYLKESVYNELPEGAKEFYQLAYCENSVENPSASDILTQFDYDNLISEAAGEYSVNTELTLENIQSIFQLNQEIDDEEMTEIEEIKRQYIFDMRNTFTISTLEGNSLIFSSTTDQNNLPVKYHVVYKGETVDNIDTAYDGDDIIDTAGYDGNVLENFYRYNNNGFISDITIGTVSKKPISANGREVDETNIGPSEDGKKYGISDYKVIVSNRDYYFQHDPFNGYMPTESVYPSTGLVIDDAYAKKAFFIAINDAKKRTLPLNATLVTKSVFEDGEYVDNFVVSDGYFGIHMIHKLFYFKGISWSCTNSIIKYNDNDRTNYDIKGFVAGLIYNGIADKGSDGKLEFKWGLDEQGNRINYYGITDNDVERVFVIESDENDDEITEMKRLIYDNKIQSDIVNVEHYYTNVMTVIPNTSGVLIIKVGGVNHDEIIQDIATKQIVKYYNGGNYELWHYDSESEEPGWKSEELIEEQIYFCKFPDNKFYKYQNGNLTDENISSSYIVDNDTFPYVTSQYYPLKYTHSELYVTDWGDNSVNVDIDGNMRVVISEDSICTESPDDCVFNVRVENSTSDTVVFYAFEISNYITTESEPYRKIDYSLYPLFNTDRDNLALIKPNNVKVNNTEWGDEHYYLQSNLFNFYDDYIFNYEQNILTDSGWRDGDGEYEDLHYRIASPCNNVERNDPGHRNQAFSDYKLKSTINFDNVRWRYVTKGEGHETIDVKKWKSKGYLDSDGYLTYRRLTRLYFKINDAEDADFSENSKFFTDSEGMTNFKSFNVSDSGKYVFLTKEETKYIENNGYGGTKVGNKESKKVPYNDYKKGNFGAFYIVAIGSNGSRAISPIYDFRGMVYKLSKSESDYNLQIGLYPYNIIDNTALNAKIEDDNFLKSLNTINVNFKINSTSYKGEFELNISNHTFDYNVGSSFDLNNVQFPDSIYIYSQSNLKYKINKKSE